MTNITTDRSDTNKPMRHLQRVIPELSVVTLGSREEANANPRILMVHGTMDRANSFKRTARQLNGFEVISYDRRGYGNSRMAETSNALEKLTWDIHLHDLISLIAQQPTIIFGHSYGGTLSLLAAEQKAPNLLGAVVFESPLPWIEKWARFPHYCLPEDAFIDPKWAACEVEKFMVEMIGEKQWTRLPPKTRRLRQSEGVTMISEMSSLAKLSPPLDPGVIDIPLILARSIDAPERHVEGMDYLHKTTKHSDLRIASTSGHGIHLSNPLEVSRLILDLLKVIKLSN